MRPGRRPWPELGPTCFCLDSILFLSRGELHGQLSHHFEEFPVLLLEAGELVPRGSAGGSFAQPAVDGAGREAVILGGLQNRHAFFFHAAEDVRLHVGWNLMRFFVHDTMVLLIDLCV